MITGGTRTIRCALLASALCLVACAGPRPVHDIRLSADHQMKLGEHGAAADGFEQIIERYPGDWYAQWRFGECCLELDRLGRARQSLEIASSLRPAHDGVAAALAETMLRQGDHDELFTFLRDRAATRQTVASHLLLARYAREMGDLDAAKLALDTALRFDEGSVEAWLEAAAFAEAIGDLDLAVRRLRRAEAVDPRDRRVLARLAELGETPGPAMVGASSRR